MITNTLILKCKELVCLRNSKVTSIHVTDTRIYAASKEGFVSIFDIIEDSVRDKVNLSHIKTFKTKQSVSHLLNF